MRRSSFVPFVAALATLGGVSVAGGNATPVTAVGLGIFLLIGATAYFGIGTERLAFLAVCLLILTITWNGVRVAGGASGDGPMAIAFAAVVAHAIVRRKSLNLPPWLLAAAVGFWLSAVIVAIFPPSNQLVHLPLIQQQILEAENGVFFVLGNRSNTSALVKYELGVVIIPILITFVGTSPRRIQTLVNLFAASAIIAAFVGILDFAGFHQLAPGPLDGNRSAGLTLQPNYLGLTCALAAPITLTWIGRSSRATLAGLAGVALLAGGEYAAGSRAGTVAFVIAITLTLLFVPRLLRLFGPVAPIAGMLLVALLVFTGLGTSILHHVRLGGGANTTGSDENRSYAASIAVTQIRTRPLEGVGFAVIGDAHDIYLEMLASGGAIALLAFLTYLGGVFASARRALAGPLSETALATAIGVVVWLANGAFDNQLGDKYLYVLPGLLIAMAHRAVEPEPQLAAVPATPDPAPPTPLRGGRPAQRYAAPPGAAA